MKKEEFEITKFHKGMKCYHSSDNGIYLIRGINFDEGTLDLCKSFESGGFWAHHEYIKLIKKL